jgi:lipoyl(octanoyl) transferase
VTLHGVAVNLDPALEHFSGILPCGIGAPGFGITSLHDLGVLVSMAELDMALQEAFAEVFEEG